MVQADQDSAKVTFPPPLMVLLTIGMGALIHHFRPWPLGFKYRLVVTGTTMVLLGVLTIIYCGFLFKKAQTDIKPWKTTSNIVLEGPYKFSRNPIYLCFVLICLGASLLINSAWVVLMTLLLFLILHEYVVKKEEAYLKQKFGSSYLEFKNSTRRWI